MKTVAVNDKKKTKAKNKPIKKVKKEHVVVVAQEIKFARLLSGNDKKTRDRVLKTFKKWLLNCFEKKYVFKEDDFIRVWKGLFYAVWMSDKPLVQEDLCDSISDTLDLFPTVQVGNAMLFFRCGLKLLATQWYGIDQHRFDKFLMLVRRWLRGALRCLHRAGWSEDACRLFTRAIGGRDGLLSPETPVYARNAMSLVLHIIDCYLEEISKVSSGAIPLASMSVLLKPLVVATCLGGNMALCGAARSLLTQLLRQSELGLKYLEKTEAWNKMGCPAGGPDALQPVSDDEEEAEGDMDDEGNEGPTALDPRAGRVNVFLSPLPVPSAALVTMFDDLLPKTGSKAFRRAKICRERFQKLSENEYPLRISEEVTEPVAKPSTKKAAKRLVNLDRSLVGTADELKLRGLSRKHRKRLLAKSRSGLSIVGDVVLEKKDTQSGTWTVESIEEASTENKKSKKIKDKDKKSNKRKSETDNTNDKGKKPKLDTDIEVVRQKKSEFSKKDKENNKKENRKNKKKLTDANEVTIKVNPKEIKNNNVIKSKGTKEIKLDKKVVEKIHTKDGKKVAKDVKKEGKTSEEAAKVIKEGIKTSKEVVQSNKKSDKSAKTMEKQAKPTLLVNKVKKITEKRREITKLLDTPKKVKFVLKNNSMQKPLDYYKSVRQSPSIPYDSTKIPTKTNLKPSTPSPINPFFKKKMKLKF